MELFEELERIKIRFVAAYDKLVAEGLLSEAAYMEIMEMIDDLDQYSIEELKEKLGQFQRMRDLGNNQDVSSY
ncbi:MAG: hypothetical protein GX316_07630 [Firmicutes bacterium]|nr:hypothetical protein [Bacillota bacterium]